MPRTRVRGDQTQDISFVSEEELNQFFGKTVITGTVDDTVVLEDFNSFFPGQGLIIQEGGVIVTTGTNFVSISGGDASVTQIDDLQDQIDQLTFDAAGVTSITASGVTVTGAVTFEAEAGIALHADGPSNTIVISGSGGVTSVSGIEGDISVEGAGEVEVTIEGNTIVVSGTPHTDGTDTVSDAIIGGENITVVSGVNTTTISSPGVVADAIVGAGEVIVISGSNTITISGTPHPEDTDTISDAIVGGVGITVTSGVSETTIDGHLRYTKEENDAIIGGENVTVVSGADTITISSVDTISDALIAGHGITITSGTSTTVIGSFDDDDVDSLTASGTTVTGSVQFASQGGISITADAGTDTVTISGGSTVGELIGNFFQIEFTNGGNTSNTWLAVSDSNLSSTTSPWVVAFPCRLAALAFSNRNENVEQDIEIHVARFGDGNAAVTEFVWELRNVRTAVKSDISITELSFEPGDKVAVFVANQGNNARDVFTGMYVEIIQRTSEEISEDWAGDLT